MKKFVYILLLLAVLLGLAYLLKNKQNQTVAAPEEVVVEETVVMEDEQPVAQEAIVVVDEEPALQEAEAVAEDVIEENPEVTADEGESIVE